MTRKQNAFTLIELLVVIAIIALLVSILMPSLSRAKVLATRVQCNANLHAVQLACQLYSNDNDEYFPSRDDPKLEGKPFASSPQTVASGAIDANTGHALNPNPTDPVLANPILNRIFFKPYLTGEKAQAMYCPAMLQTRGPNSSGYSTKYITYSYFNYPAKVQSSYPSYKSPWVPEYKPDLTKAGTALANDPMWACLTVATSGIPTIFHGLDSGSVCEGMNCVRAGGSSDWVPWPSNRVPVETDAVEIAVGTTTGYYWPTTK